MQGSKRLGNALLTMSEMFYPYPSIIAVSSRLILTRIYSAITDPNFYMSVNLGTFGRNPEERGIFLGSVTRGQPR